MSSNVASGCAYIDVSSDAGGERPREHWSPVKVTRSTGEERSRGLRTLE